MNSNINIEIIREFAEQYNQYIESNKRITNMISTKETDENWSENFHLIDHDWLVKWKDKIYFDHLGKKYYGKKKYEEALKCVEELNQQNQQDQKNIPEKLDKLDNKTIYYEVGNKDSVDPMKTFDIITDEVWRLFDIKDENKNYNGKVSILKGNRKIIIRIDDNNYCVKYRTNDDTNYFGEFVIVFKSQKNEEKKIILNDVNKSNIYKWMKKIGFKSDLKNFTVNQDKISFDIAQKTNNYYLSDIMSFVIPEDDNWEKLSNQVSFSICSFSFPSKSYNNSSNFSFLSSDEFQNFFNEITNFRYIQKYEKTTNILCVMRCLSIIGPLSEYFMSPIKLKTIFFRFHSKSLLNLIRDYFIEIWSDEKSIFQPKDFTSYFKDNQNKTNIKIEVEQDPYKFLEYIINYINKKLYNIDYDFQFNFNNIENILKKESLSQNIQEIIKKNNSIASQCFDGLMIETYKCNKCKQNFEKIKIFNTIEIDYRKIINNVLQKEGNSFASLEIDDFWEYYFLRKSFNDNELPTIECPKCKEESKIIKREILVYPQYLIIRLIEGEFDEKKGFVIKDEIPDIYINYKKIKSLKVYKYKGTDYINVNCDYNLIGMVNYLYEKETEIRFISICKSVFWPKKNRKWISFSCGSSPCLLEGDYRNSKTHPYLLFYEKNK